MVLSYWTGILSVPKKVIAASSDGYQVIGGDGDEATITADTKIIGGAGKSFYTNFDYFKSDGLLSALEEYTKDLVRAGYDGRVKIQVVGSDKANIKKWDTIKEVLQADRDSAMRHAKNHWYIPKEFSKVPIPDKKIIDTLYTITDPKILGGYDNWPVSLNRVNKGHLCNKEHCKQTDESALDKPESERTSSPHSTDITQAVDWDANGQIKCTLVTCDDENDPNNGHNGDDNGRCDKKNSRGYDETTNQTRPQAFKPTDIEFKKILNKDPDNSEQMTGNNAATGIAGSPSLTELFQKPKEDVYKFIASTVEMINKPEELIAQTADKLPNNPTSFAPIIGQNILLQEMGYNNLVDYFPKNFKEFVKQSGQQILANDVFNGQFEAQTFEGEDGYEWASNIGARSLEKAIGIPNKSFLAGDQEVLTTVGQRVMEDILGLTPGALKSNVTNYDQLVKSIGQGFMEKSLYLDQGNLAGNTLDEVKNKIGADKFDQIFASRNASIVASALQIDVNVYSNNLNNFAELKRLVGEKTLDQNIRIYEQYTVKDIHNNTVATLDSRDEMLNLLNYKKPEIDSAKNVIITYNQITREISEIPLSYNPLDPNSYTYTYEKLLSDKQEQNSLTRKFLKGENLQEVYKNIGSIRVAKGLSSIVEEQLDIYQFLLAGSIPKMNVKYSDQISAEIYAFDAQEVAERIGLHDWYDLYKIFIKNRGNEIYPYYGMEIMVQSLNSSTDTNQLTNVISNSENLFDQRVQFTASIINEIKEIVNQLNDKNIQDDINLHLDNALKELDVSTVDNIKDAASNPPQKKVAASLKNIGQILIQNNLNTTTEAKQIYQKIYEINKGATLDSWLPDATKLNISTNYGLTRDNLTNFFSQDIGQININQLVTKAASGGLLYGMDMDKEYSEAEEELNGIINSNNNPISALIDGFGKENFTNLAEVLNISLSLPNDQKLSSQEIAQIFNGDWITLTKKIANQPISDGLGVSFIDLLTNGSLASQIPDEVFSYANIVDSNISTVRNLLSSISSGNFISQTIDTGFNSIFNLMDLSKVTGIPQANDILGKFKDLFKKGMQSIGLTKDIQGLAGTIGEFIPKSLISGDLSKAVKEIGSINLSNLLKGEGIGLDQVRIFSGLKLPDLSQINEWVSNQFGDIGDKLSTVYGELNKMGLTELLKSNGQNVNYAYIDNILKNKVDSNIPNGFARAMLSGDQSTLLSVSAEWIKNSIKNPTEAETTALNALSNVLSGNMSAASITSASMDIIFSNENFKNSLKNAGITQESFRGLVGSIASGNLDKNTAINIGKQIVLNNMVNNGADAKNIAAVSGVLDLLSGDITPARGVSAAMSFLSQDEKFKESLAKSGLSLDNIQNLISAGLNGNLGKSQAISLAKDIVLNNLKKDKDVTAKSLESVSAVFDLLSSDMSQASIASAVTNYLSKDTKFQESLAKAGIPSSAVGTFINSALSGKVDQGQAVSIIKDVTINNIRKGLEKETDPNKIKAGEQNITIVEGAFTILNGGSPTQVIVSTGLSIINKNESFKESLTKAGISSGSFNNLITAAVSGNISQSQAINLAGDIILNKIQGVQNKQIAQQVLNILGSGGSFNASNITSIITTAFGDKIDVMFKGMNIAPGGGAQILGALASGNVQAAAGAIIGAQLDKALTSAMDGLTKTAVGTTGALHEALHSSAVASKEGLADAKSIINGDKTATKDFFNFKKIGNMLKNAAISMATAYAASMIAQVTGLPPELVDSILKIAIGGANPITLIGTLMHDFLHISIPGLSFLGLGGSGGKIIKEVYCAMDYYPWLQDDYPQFKPDEIYKGIYYWPNTTTIDSNVITNDSTDYSSSTQIMPGDKVEKGFSEEVPKQPDRVGENLPGRPPYEFKSTPSGWQSVVQKKLPSAVYMKATQLVWNFVDLATHFDNKEMRPGQVIIPQWVDTKVAVTDDTVKSTNNKEDPTMYEGLGGEILNKFMASLDLLYGRHYVDANANETDVIVQGYTMKENLKSEGYNVRSGFWQSPVALYWLHLTW